MCYRASGVCYVHQKKNYELVVDPLIVEYGVGQYDSDWNKIEAEWYMKLSGAAAKNENPRYGFDVEIFEDHSWRSYRMFTLPLESLEADLIDLKLVIKLNGSGSCKLDYFKFYK